MKKDPSEVIEDLIGSAPGISGKTGQLLAYQERLSRWNRKVSLTSVPDSEILLRLILPSAWLGLQYLKMEIGVVADFGTGAGIPGIPMAIIDSRNKYLLIDSSQKKSAFVRTCLSDREVISGKNLEMRTCRIGRGIWEEKVNAVVTRGAGTMLETVRLWEGKLAAPGFLDFFKGERMEQESAELEEAYPAARVETIAVPEWFGNLKLARIQIDR